MARRNRLEDVIEAAIRVFHQKGYASASIQDVADEVGMLKGSLYHYIESKEALLARIFEDSAGQFEEMLAQVGKLEGPPVERLRHFARHWYQRRGADPAEAIADRYAEMIVATVVGGRPAKATADAYE